MVIFLHSPDLGIPVYTDINILGYNIHLTYQYFSRPQVALSLGRKGAIAPKPRPCPQMNIKRCLSNTKHQHIGAKGAFCRLQNTPKYVSALGSAPDHAGGAHDAPQTL